MTDELLVKQYIYMAVRSSVPWHSIYAEPLPDKRLKKTSDVYTDQRQIDMCLNCPAPECNNCIDGWHRIKYARPRKARRT